MHLCKAVKLAVGLGSVSSEVRVRTETLRRTTYLGSELKIVVLYYHSAGQTEEKLMSSIRIFCGPIYTRIDYLVNVILET